MSPTATDTRTELVAVAARLLAEGGPQAVSVRRVAAEVGTSTMALYTHYGSKPELLRAVVLDGFRNLADRMSRVRRTDDPVADLAGLARAYRRAALDQPNLFKAMFDRSPGETLTDIEDQRVALSTFLVLVEAVQRAIDAGRIDECAADQLALEAWSTVHGLVSLEVAGGIQSTGQATLALTNLIRYLAIGAGDDRDRAAASVPHPR